jgi:hypothetical protein
MDINSPTNSRLLAIFIQNIAAEDRPRFLEDARKAEDMEDFLPLVPKYKSKYSQE